MDTTSNLSVRLLNSEIQDADLRKILSFLIHQGLQSTQADRKFNSMSAPNAYSYVRKLQNFTQPDTIFIITLEKNKELVGVTVAYRNDTETLKDHDIIIDKMVLSPGLTPNQVALYGNKMLNPLWWFGASIGLHMAYEELKNIFPILDGYGFISVDSFPKISISNPLNGDNPVNRTFICNKVIVPPANIKYAA